jgi:hypothetical protein
MRARNRPQIERIPKHLVLYLTGPTALDRRFQQNPASPSGQK